MHMYPFPPGPTQTTTRSKRRQVKIACSNCQKACKKCDDARPCMRCVKYGISEECVDSRRKARKKGGRRGPYKKRDIPDRAGSTADHLESEVLPVPEGGEPVTPAGPPPVDSQYTSPYYYYEHAMYQPRSSLVVAAGKGGGSTPAVSYMQQYYPSTPTQASDSQSRDNQHAADSLYYPPYSESTYDGQYYAYYYSRPRPLAAQIHESEIA